MFESGFGGDPVPEGSGGDGGTPPPADAAGLAGLERVAPGPELAALVHRVDLGSVTDGFDLVEVVAACRRLKAWADAVEVAAAATLARHPVCHAPEADRRGFTPVRAAGQLLAARLGLAPTSACDRVVTAVQLVDELPDTVAALHQGEIDYPKAAALAAGVRQLDPPDGACDRYTGEVVSPDGLRRGLVAEVEARVLPKAGRRSLRQHRDAIARAVAAVAPKTLEQRHQRACEQRRVDYSPSPDGMAWLGVYGPAEDVTAIRVMLDAAVDAAKREDPADTRTADQLRVDVLAQLAWSSLQSGHIGGHCGQDGVRLGKRHRRAATVNVTVPVSTLVGLDDAPGELEGYGPIPASAARRIAAHGTWRRLLTDPTSGALLDYGTTRYTPPADLVDHLIARDRTCRFPTCSQPARRTQIDHTIAAGTNGWSTSDHNCGPLCGGGCHNAKTHGRWRLEQPEPGRYIWTAPTGHRYPIDPEIVGPIIRRHDTPAEPPEPEPPPELDLPPF
jgi:putative component of membrane protein insertase Oxa1/YidC/SpoIIIJ protein YidD